MPELNLSESSTSVASSDPEASNHIKERFERVKALVLEKKPILKDILEKHGHKSLYEYALDYFDVNTSPHLSERREEFLKTFHKQVAHLLGDKVAASACDQLRKYYFVSTADHHGPLCDSFFLSSNILTALAGVQRGDPAFENVIVLSCANVSLNNSSFPRGLLFHEACNGDIQTQRLSFLPSNSHSCSVYKFRPYLEREVQKVKTILKENVRDQCITQAHADVVDTLLNTIYAKKDVLSDCADYSEQVTKTNFEFWKHFFGNTALKIPNLIYLEQETLVIELLRENHLDKDTMIRRMFFDDQYEALLYKYFEGIQGAFSREKQWGTYLFWGLSKEKNYRVPLWKQGKELRSTDGSIVVPLTPEGLKESLDKGVLIPSMLTIFLILSFYYGLKCLGGFSQVNYLTFMKEAYQKFLRDVGQDPAEDISAVTQTKELVGDVIAAFMRGPKGQLVPAAGLDLILYGNEETLPTLYKEINNITLIEALYPMMPDFYRIIYPESERDPELASLTLEHVTKYMGLDKKIEPCIVLT